MSLAVLVPLHTPFLPCLSRETLALVRAGCSYRTKWERVVLCDLKLFLSLPPTMRRIPTALISTARSSTPVTNGYGLIFCKSVSPSDVAASGKVTPSLNPHINALMAPHSCHPQCIAGRAGSVAGPGNKGGKFQRGRATLGLDSSAQPSTRSACKAGESK